MFPTITDFIFEFLYFFCPVWSAVLPSAARYTSVGRFQDGLVEVLTGPVDIRIITFDALAQFVRECGKLNPVSFTVVPAWERFGVARLVVHVDS